MVMRIAAALIPVLLITAVAARPTTRSFIATTQEHSDVESCEHFHTTSFTTLGAEHLRIGNASPVIRLTTRSSAIRIDEVW